MYEWIEKYITFIALKTASVYKNVSRWLGLKSDIIDLIGKKYYHTGIEEAAFQCYITACELCESHDQFIFKMQAALKSAGRCDVKRDVENGIYGAAVKKIVSIEGFCNGKTDGLDIDSILFIKLKELVDENRRLRSRLKMHDDTIARFER